MFYLCNMLPILTIQRFSETSLQHGRELFLLIRVFSVLRTTSTMNTSRWLLQTFLYWIIADFWIQAKPQIVTWAQGAL